MTIALKIKKKLKLFFFLILQLSTFLEHTPEPSDVHTHICALVQSCRTDSVITDYCVNYWLIRKCFSFYSVLNTSLR